MSRAATDDDPLPIGKPVEVGLFGKLPSHGDFLRRRASAWRFVCAAGACGPEPVIGLMVPSVDRVGRYFPLTLVVNLPPDVNPIAAIDASAAFFDRATAIAWGRVTSPAPRKPMTVRMVAVED